MRKSNAEGGQDVWRRRACGVVSLAAASGLLTGCGGQKAATETKPRDPRPEASPSASPFPIGATAQGLTLTLTDAKGVRVAVIKARAGTVGPQKAPGSDTPSGGDVAGALVNGVATLYQNGKPAATLAADRINADRATKTVVAVGNVRVKSLAQTGDTSGAQTTARADTATWRYGENKIVGTGNVVIARGDEINLPGKSFVADTAIRTFTLVGSGAPATGTF